MLYNNQKKLNLKKICVVTGTKEEYDFLYKLIESFSNDLKINLQLLVTGKHLSPDFGLTYKEIEQKFKIDKKIEMYPKLDTSISISNSLGLLIMGFASALEDLKPDFVVVCSNSYTTYGACITSTIANIPILNIFSKSIIDTKISKSILESIVKMSEINFVKNNEEKNSLIAFDDKAENIQIFQDLNTICAAILNKKLKKLS